MSNHYKKGDKVNWNYEKSKASGEILNQETKRITITTQGKKVTRNGSSDNPAYKIKQKNGTRVLKLQSELKSTKS